MPKPYRRPDGLASLANELQQQNVHPLDKSGEKKMRRIHGRAHTLDAQETGLPLLVAPSVNLKRFSANQTRLNVLQESAVIVYRLCSH